MNAILRVVAALGAMLLAAAASTAIAQPTFAASDVVGQVYVNNNTAGINTISGFHRQSDGTLMPIPGTPFPIGGSGTGTPVGSQGAIQLADGGRYLLAVDAGSNHISVARIRRDGTLEAVGSPVSSGGIRPVSIAVHGRLVYVANAGEGGSNYTGFRLTPSGYLHPIKNSTYPLPDNALPGDILFDPDGKHLVGMRVGPDEGPSFIDSFNVGSDGRLTPAPGSPFPSQGVGPFGSAFRPTNGSQLYVSIAHDGPGNGSVSALNLAANGALSPISPSVFRDEQSGACWLEVSHDGRYVFVVNTGNPSISRFEVRADGTLTLLGTTPFNNGRGLRPFDLRLDPTGSYLYVTGAGAAAISVFAVNGGSLTEIPASPVSLNVQAAPFGIVVR